MVLNANCKKIERIRQIPFQFKVLVVLILHTMPVVAMSDSSLHEPTEILSLSVSGALKCIYSMQNKCRLHTV